MRTRICLLAAVVLCIELCVVGKFIDDDQIPYVKNKNGSMIPDKYNTGPDPNSDILMPPLPPPDGKMNINGFIFVRGHSKDENHTKAWYGASHLVLDFHNCKNVTSVTIENYNFTGLTMDFLDNHKNLNVKRKIVFKNCYMGSFRGNRIRNENATFEFYDCDFESAYGSYLKFERCVFHPTLGDGLDIYTHVEVKDSYIYTKGDIQSGQKHIDGFQTFGSTAADTEFVNFTNVRIELPKIKMPNGTSGWATPAINAPIMVQVEFSEHAHDIYLNNMHVNGGGYTIYWHCVKQCQLLDNSVARNIQVGYGHLFKKFWYPSNSRVDNKTCIFENVEYVTTPYIGTAWKSSAGVHVSVTNELLTNRTMVCVADGKTNTTHFIRAHMKIHQHLKKEELPQFDDLPYDMDFVVADKDAIVVSCYDVTETGNVSTSPLIKTIDFSLESAVSSTVSMLLVLLSLFIALMM